MTTTKVKVASDKAHYLDVQTRELLTSVQRKNNSALRWFLISWTILFILAVFGLYKQVEIANSNKAYIDCIAKLFTTPTPKGSLHKVITDPGGNCNIKGQN